MADLTDWKLELVAVPVSDVDRAKASMPTRSASTPTTTTRSRARCASSSSRQPGSGCSIAIGTGIMETEPGSVQGLQLVVSDIEAARAHLAERGVEVSEISDFPWGRFVFFSDPDGNGWAVQQIPARSWAPSASST